LLYDSSYPSNTWKFTNGVDYTFPAGISLANNEYLLITRVDRVNYDDKAPWPTTADGEGDSLDRITDSDYGNDVANWQAASPTPGQ
jgi:hypothetical protein